MMSDTFAMFGEVEFDSLLRSVLLERVAEAEPGAGLEQRLQARLAQEGALSGTARPFAFAERVRTQRSAAANWFAFGVHAAALLLIVAVASRQVGITLSKPAKVVELAVPRMTPPVAPKLEQIGGGGGHHDLAPASKGHLPKFAAEQIVPPNLTTIKPRLVLEPTLVMQKDLKMADSTLPNFGDPGSTLNGVSLGNGVGTGIGSGHGNGVGPGSGGNTGGGLFHVGGGVSKPQILFEPEAEFSEEARKAKFSGSVEVYLIVDELGNPSHIRVARGVGMGLDEKAIDAVRQYKFKPAMKGGKPVKVDLYIEVNFQIL